MKRKLLCLLLSVSMMTTALTGCSEGQSATKSREEISDWTKAYDEYFNENQLMRDNSKHITSINHNGVNIDMSNAISGENYCMSFDFEIAQMNVYCIDKVLYGNIITGEGGVWAYAPIESEMDFESFIEVDIPIENENIVSWEYKEEITENGIIYDTLTVTTDNENSSILCYINRETQKIDKYIKYEGDKSTEFLVEDVEKIELPAAAATATPGTVEEIAAGFSTLLTIAAMSGSTAE